MGERVIVTDLGLTRYEDVQAAMQAFTAERGPDATNEIWLTEHQPVFTQGQAGKPEHLLSPGDVPVVQSDRGGQITYHAPGQIVAYLLFDLRRMGMSVRTLVSGIESAVIDVLRGYGIEGAARADAPGVYVGGAKIAALGLRVRRGCSYHGLSFNIDMNLEPYSRINPCGLLGLEVTQLSHLVGTADLDQVKLQLLSALESAYGVTCRTSDTLPASTA